MKITMRRVFAIFFPENRENDNAVRRCLSNKIKWFYLIIVLEQYFGCEVKIAEYKNKLPLPIFMTMRDITMVEIYGVKPAIIN